MMYTIAKNSHEASPRVYQEYNAKKGWAIEFTPQRGTGPTAAWLTDLGNKTLNLQSSKIGGGSFGTGAHSLFPFIPAHQWDSGRGGLRPTTKNNDGMTQTGMLDVMAYFYNRGILTARKLCEINPTEKTSIVCMFRRDIGKIHYTAGDMKDYKAFPFNWLGVPETGYLCYPFFGGNAPAPHELKMEMDLTIL